MDSDVTPPDRIPGILGMEHIGITVPDLEQATRFFADILGGRVVFDSGPIRFDDGDGMTELLNVHPRATIHRMRHIRVGHGTNIELFEYSAPDQRWDLPKNSDIGGHHLAFYSDDFDATLAWFKQNGVRCLAGPNTVTSGPNAGSRWIYFLTPWGLQMELVSWPNGRAYQSQTAQRLWSPLAPDR